MIQGISKASINDDTRPKYLYFLSKTNDGIFAKSNQHMVTLPVIFQGFQTFEIDGPLDPKNVNNWCLQNKH